MKDNTGFLPGGRHRTSAGLLVAGRERWLEVYAHVLPDMQREAAETIGALLHGRVR